MTGTVTGAPRQLLRLEGLLVLVAASVTYGRLEAGWWPFALLFFAPDLTLLGYGAGRAAGAALYNAGHWYGLPAVCLAWGVLAQAPEILAAGLIWAGQIQGLIHDIPTCQELITRIVDDATAIIQHRLAGLVTPELAPVG